MPPIGWVGSANFIAVSNNNNEFNAPAIHIVHIVNSSKWLYGTYVYTQSCMQCELLAKI